MKTKTQLKKQRQLKPNLNSLLPKRLRGHGTTLPNLTHFNSNKNFTPMNVLNLNQPIKVKELIAYGGIKNITFNNVRGVFNRETTPPNPPTKNDNRNEDEGGRNKKALVVIYKDGSREVYCPAKKIKEEKGCAHIEFYNKMLELKKISSIEEL
jgi:hypothetical protein